MKIWFAKSNREFQHPLGFCKTRASNKRNGGKHAFAISAGDALWGISTECLCMGSASKLMREPGGLQGSANGDHKSSRDHRWHYEAYPWGPGRTPPLPAYCWVEGAINRRTGVDGEDFGITFALAMPENWNGDFLMQGGAGSNGVVMQPLGLDAEGDKPALVRGFAVVSTDTGHHSHHSGFDFILVKDEQAYLDFASLANAEVTTLSKELIALYYRRPTAFSYFSDALPAAAKA